MRKNFLFLVLASLCFCSTCFCQHSKANIVVVIADQWRAQATGYNGNKAVQTPQLDALAKTSINVKNAVSGMSVCTPFRGQFLTGQYPLTTGVFMNDVMLDTGKLTMPDIFKAAGYNTAFIGKWHLDGHGRNSYIPENRRHGFEYWKALECTHDYNKSLYYANNSQQKLFWEGYDAIAQADDAIAYIEEKAKQKNPFFMVVSMGPPHDPYPSAPEKYKQLYQGKNISLDPNVPADVSDKIQKNIKNYYAHISALDDCIGKITAQLKNSGIDDNTIFIFTADHGDLMGAHGEINKQQPYSESIKVPFLIHYPGMFGDKPMVSSILLNSPDIMPTIMGMSKMPIPETVEGYDYSKVLLGKKKNKVNATLISCVQPFGQWSRSMGGREYRGVVTDRYTYVRDLKGPWLFFDNVKDPYQLTNLIGNMAYKKQQNKLDKCLQSMLKKRQDDFRPGMEYVKQWNYTVDETETVPYVNMNYEGKPVVE